MENNKRYTLGIDCDGVQRDFTTSFNNQFQKDFPKYKDAITEITRWDWYYDYPWKNILIDIGIEEELITQEVIEKYSNNWFKFRSPEIFSQAEIYSNVYNNIKTIIDIFEDELEFNIITHQQDITAVIATLNWLKQYKIIDLIPNVIFVNKMQDKKDNCDIIIDDSPEVIADFNSAKESKICIKVETLYNKDIPCDLSITSLSDSRLFERIHDAILVLDVFKLANQ